MNKSKKIISIYVLLLLLGFVLRLYSAQGRVYFLNDVLKLTGIKIKDVKITSADGTEVLFTGYPDETSYYGVYKGWFLNGGRDKLVSAIKNNDLELYARWKLFWGAFKSLHTDYPMSIVPLSGFYFGLPAIFITEFLNVFIDSIPKNSGQHFRNFIKINRVLTILSSLAAILVGLFLFNFFSKTSFHDSEMLMLALSLALLPGHIVVSGQVTYNFLDVFLQLILFGVALYCYQCALEEEMSFEKELLWLKKLGIIAGLAMGIKWSVLSLAPLIFILLLITTLKVHSEDKYIFLIRNFLVFAITGSLSYLVVLLHTISHDKMLNHTLAAALRMIVMPGREFSLYENFKEFVVGTLSSGLSSIFLIFFILAMLFYFKVKKNFFDYFLILWFLILLSQGVRHPLGIFPMRNMLLQVIMLILFYRALSLIFGQEFYKNRRSLMISILIIINLSFSLNSLSYINYVNNDKISFESSKWILKNLPSGSSVGLLKRPWYAEPMILRAMIGKVVPNKYIFNIAKRPSPPNLIKKIPDAPVIKTLNMYMENTIWSLKKENIVLEKEIESIKNSDFAIITSMMINRYTPYYSKKDFIKIFKDQDFVLFKQFRVKDNVSNISWKVIMKYAMSKRYYSGVDEVLVFKKVKNHHPKS